MKVIQRAAVAALLMATVAAMAAPLSPQTTQLTEFVRDTWKVPEFQLGLSDVEVLRQIVAAMLRQPEPLVGDALEYALKNKWLGRYECSVGGTPAWRATISFDRAQAHTTGPTTTYRDVTLKIGLADGGPTDQQKAVDAAQR